MCGKEWLWRSYSLNLVGLQYVFPKVCVVCWLSLQFICWYSGAGDTVRWELQQLHPVSGTVVTFRPGNVLRPNHRHQLQQKSMELPPVFQKKQPYCMFPLFVSNTRLVLSLTCFWQVAGFLVVAVECGWQLFLIHCDMKWVKNKGWNQEVFGSRMHLTVLVMQF